MFRKLLAAVFALALLPISAGADTFPLVKGDPAEFQYVGVWDECGSIHAPTIAERDLMKTLCDLLPPRTFESVEVKGGALRVYVSREVAISMNTNRLQAYLTVSQFLDLWRAHSGYQTVTAVFAFIKVSPVYQDIQFIVVSTTATGYKMLMG